MHYLRDIEERIDESRRQAVTATYTPRDLEVLESLQRQAEATGFRKHVATALVQLGLKLDREAALPYVSRQQQEAA